MPKRSNHFQQLIFRLQSALYGSGCQIEESAFVHNHVSGKDDEIDVLVTFYQGSQVYRTGIACRDQSRSAGPSWIRDLAGQRKQCRIDKMIAFHSKGFTDAAYKVGVDENLGLYKASQIDCIDIRQALGHLMTVLVRVIPDDIVFVEPLDEKLPAGAEGGLAALIIDGKDVGPSSFGKSCRDLIVEWCQNQIYSGGKMKGLPKAYSQVSRVEFNVGLPTGSLARLNAGPTFAIAYVNGNATVEHELKYMVGTGRHQIGAHDVFDLEASFFGQGAKVLVATAGEKMAYHFEAKPGADLKIDSFTTERRIPDNPFPSFEVKWRPESTMIVGPHVAEAAGMREPGQEAIYSGPSLCFPSSIAFRPPTFLLPRPNIRDA